MMDLATLGIDASILSGRLAAASGGVTLILLGRWLLRAQVVASLVRTAGFFVILLGVLAVSGVVDVDVSALSGVVRTLVEALPSTGV
jgi:hypothetical protein